MHANFKGHSLIITLKQQLKIFKIVTLNLKQQILTVLKPL